MPSNPYDDLIAAPGAVATGATASNPYDDLIVDEQARQQTQLRASVSLAAESNPQTIAAQRQLAKYVGFKPAIGEALPDQVKQMATVKRVADDTAGQPVLQKAYTDADFARIGHDDSSALSAVGNAVKYLVSAPGQTNTFAGDVGAGVYNASRGSAGLFQAAAELFAPLLDPLAGTILPENPLRRVAAGFAEMGAGAGAIAKRLSPPQQGIAAGGVSSGVQSLTQNVLMLPAAFVNPAAALYAMAGTQGGQSYQDAREKGVAELPALAFATSQAAIEYATEKLPLNALIGNLKASAPLWKTVANQIATEVPGEQLATVLQDMNEWAVLNPEKPFSGYLAERPSAAAQTLIATVIGVGGNIAIGKGIQTVIDNAGGRQAQIEEAQTHVERLQDLFTRATQTKTWERDPDTFGALVQQMADGTPNAPTSVFVDAPTLVEVLQNNPEAAGVFNQMPQEVKDQVQEALTRTGTVEIPIGELVAKGAGTALESALLPHIRRTENSLSATEAKEASAQSAAYLQQEAERVIAESQQGEALRSSSDAVGQKVLDQLNAVGRNTPDVNATYATLIKSFYTATSARLGMTPEEMYTRYPLAIQGETVGEVLDQPGSAKFNKWFGGSKVVGKDGKPLVVYHGTKADISGGVFRSSGQGNTSGIFFTGSPSIASNVYAGAKERFDTEAVQKHLTAMSDKDIVAALEKASTKDHLLETLAELAFPEDYASREEWIAAITKDLKSRSNVEEFVDTSASPADEFAKRYLGMANSRTFGEGANVVPTYLSLQNPMEIDGSNESFHVDQMAQWLEDARSNGNDGLIIRNFDDGGFFSDGRLQSAGRHDVFVAFDPTQVKSATGNNGNFDGTDPNILNQSAKGDSYTQQAEALAQKIEGAGGTVRDLLQVDQLIDSANVPTITLQDLVGLDIFPTIADRTAAAALYTGIDSSGLDVAIPLLGGPFFPLRESNASAGVVWANRGKGVIAQKEAKLKEGANYMMVLMGDADMHMSNSTVAAATMGTIEAWQRDGRMSAEQVEALGALVRALGAEARETSDVALATAQEAVAAAPDEAALKKANEKKTAEQKKRAVAAQVEGFPGFADAVVMHRYMDAMSFDGRKRVIEILASKKALALNAPPMNLILDATREPSLAGKRWGDGVLLVEVDQTNPQVELGTEGTTAHPDFPVGVRGKIVGRLNAPLNWELLWQDWLKTKKGDSPRRSFELTKPIVSVTQELIDRIGPITQNNVDSARQARLAADFAADNWRRTGVPVNKGGASPQEFVDAILTTAARPVLTEYTAKQVTQGAKNGSFKAFQLGADGRIFFGLKYGDPGYAADYGITIPEITANEIALVSVVNNEQGARGLAAPAVVLKALQEGATVLDCFAVKNERFTDGFLPEIYAAFGFEKVAEIPFAPEYYSPQKLADAVKFWKDTTPGYDPATHGFPPLVIMKWKGSDADRTDIINRYLRDGVAGVLARGASAAVQADVDRVLSPAGTEGVAQGRAADAQRDLGDQGNSVGARISSRAQRTVQGIAGLNDGELKNLGLTTADRAAVQRALGIPATDNASLTDAAGTPAAIGPGVLNQGPRGTYNPQTLTISLLQNADLSTFLHESGHFFLEVMADLASQPNAPAEIQADFAKILKWFGVKDAEDGTKALDVWHAMTLDEKRPHHERWAESFEQYLIEGRAPSLELRGAFQRFRSWLITVYKSLKDFAAGRELQISGEIRAVMDRLVATEEQIAEAEQQAKYEAIYKSAEEAGMTPDEWATYQEQHRAGTDSAIDEMQKRSMADLRWAAEARSKALRKAQRAVEDLRKAMHAQVTEEVMATPLELARAYIKSLPKSTPEHKVRVKLWTEQRVAVLRAALKEEKVALIAANPDTTVLNTKKGQMLAKHKRDIANAAEAKAMAWEEANPKPLPVIPDVEMDSIAERFGFESGDQLTQTMRLAPSAKETIEGITEQRLLEEHGELVTQKGIQQAANEAVHNEARARFVATELATMQHAMRQTAKAPGAKVSTNVLVKAAKDFAKAIVGRRKIMDLNPGRYTAAETRAAAAVQKAMAAGDQAGAVSAQRDRLLNLYAAKQTVSAREELKRAVEYLRKFEKDAVRSKLPSEYLDQIDALLEKFDLKQATTQKEIARRKSLATWIQSQQDLGIEPNIPQELIDKAALTSYKDMTVDEFRGLTDTIKQIEHLARLKSKLLTAKDKREYEAIRDGIAKSINDLAGNRKADTRTPTTNAGRWFQAVKNFGAAHIKAATLARILDGGADGGLVWEYFVRPANERGDMETTMRAEAAEKLHAIIEPWLAGKPAGGKGVFFPSIKRSLNRESILTIALNTGNESNLQRLLGGEGWTIDQLKPVLNTLTRGDWNVVQQIWDHFESYRPLIGAKEMRVYGKEPEWIAHGSTVTAAYSGAGVTGLSGGYYPIKYDPAASVRAEEHADAEGAKRLLKGAYGAATTQRSFTKGRVDEVNGRPLLYTLSGLYSGVNDVIHDLAWHEWLIDVNRLLKSQTIDSAIREHYGPEAVRQLKTWRDAVAEGDSASHEAMDGALSRLRQGVSVAGLGFNVMSALMQPLGLTQSIVRVGAKWIGEGMMQYIANPSAATKDVHERSEFMASRARTRFRELNEIRNNVQGQSKAKAAMTDTAYFLMMQCQQMVDVPTWLGAYEKAMSEGNDDERSGALADQAVIDSQGGGMTKDLSAIERGGPAQKLFTVFYSFMNTALNLGVQKGMNSEPTTKGRAKLAADMLMLYTVPAVLGALLKDALTPGDSGDGDDWRKLLRKMLGEQLGFLLGLVVVGREFGEAGKGLLGLSDHPRDYAGPAGVRMIADAGAAAKQIQQGEFDDAMRKAVINLAGDIFGLPAAQMNRTITGAKALAEGKTRNPAALALGYQEPN